MEHREAIWIKADGTVETVILVVDRTDNDLEDPLLDQVQQLVDGWLGYIRLDGDTCMLVDEEGTIKCLRENKIASHIAHCYGEVQDRQIVGDVVILRTTGWGGMVGLDERQRENIKRLIEEAR